MNSLILESLDGTAVRYLAANTDTFYMIHRLDSRRVEAVADPSQCKVRYHIIDKIRISDLKKGPLPISSGHKLRLIEEESTFPIAKSPVLKDEPKSHMRRTALAVGLLNLLILLYAFMLAKPLAQIDEIQTVMIVPRGDLPVVPPAPSQSTNNAQLKRMGALAVLGSSRSMNQIGGLRVSANSSRGPGLGGLEGSGGVQSSLYGKGLMGSALGLGNKINGGGGVGTKGKGGGSPGYGSLTLIGSKGTQLLPLTEEAVFDDGGLDRDEINAVIQRNLGQIRFCYEEALQTLPELTGRVAIRFVIGGSGFVNAADIANTSLKNKGVENCIVTRLKSWRFPEPRGGVRVRVTYPFVLKRVSQG